MKLKQQSIKYSRPVRVINGVVIVAVLIALLLTTDTGARFLSNLISKVTGAIVPPEKIQQVARFIVPIGLGVFLITSGIAALSVPVLGVVMVVAGLALIGFSMSQIISTRRDVRPDMKKRID
jgi:phage-related minor tail protein